MKRPKQFVKLDNEFAQKLVALKKLTETIEFMSNKEVRKIKKAFKQSKKV